jgi:hypothetical protein
MATNGPSTVDRGDRAYEFRMFGTKKALCFGLVCAAFDRLSDDMSQAAEGARGTAVAGDV